MLGDKYANDAKWGGATSGKHVTGLHGKTGIYFGPGYAQASRLRALMGLPWRYALACVDQLGLILREDCIGDEDGGAYVWAKKNGLPESVTDRCRRGHEYVFHFVTQQRYFSALDELREPHEMKPQRLPGGRETLRHVRGNRASRGRRLARRDRRGRASPRQTSWFGVDDRVGAAERPGMHRACPRPRWPEAARLWRMAWIITPRSRLTLLNGSSRLVTIRDLHAVRRRPYPVTSYTGEQGRRPGGQRRHAGRTYANLSDAALRVRAIIGYACACPEPSLARRPGCDRGSVRRDGDDRAGGGRLGRTGLTFDLSGGYCEAGPVADHRTRPTCPGFRCPQAAACA